MGLNLGKLEAEKENMRFYHDSHRSRLKSNKEQENWDTVGKLGKLLDMFTIKVPTVMDDQQEAWILWKDLRTFLD